MFGNLASGYAIPPRNINTRNAALASARFASARRVPAINMPMPANAMVPSRSTPIAGMMVLSNFQPSATPVATIDTTWSTSIASTLRVLAASSPPRDNGVEPSRFKTPYRRSKPVAMPRLTIALAMTASDSTPGTRKSIGSPVIELSGFTLPKNTKMPIGMASVTRRLSPRRSVMASSNLVCAATAEPFTGHSVGCGRPGRHRRSAALGSGAERLLPSSRGRSATP